MNEYLIKFILYLRSCFFCRVFGGLSLRPGFSEIFQGVLVELKKSYRGMHASNEKCQYNTYVYLERVIFFTLWNPAALSRHNRNARNKSLGSQFSYKDYLSLSLAPSLTHSHAHHYHHHRKTAAKYNLKKQQESISVALCLAANTNTATMQRSSKGLRDLLSHLLPVNTRGGEKTVGPPCNQVQETVFGIHGAKQRRGIVKEEFSQSI